MLRPRQYTPMPTSGSRVSIRFYALLEAYDSVLTPDTLLVLPADAALFRS